MIKPLPETKNKNGCHYKLVKRTEKTAMYSQQYIIDREIQDKIVGYEIFKIKITPAKEFKGVLFPEREQFPRDEDFGQTAWTYSTLETTEKKFEELDKGITVNL
jgi:hypothetical protein